MNRPVLKALACAALVTWSSALTAQTPPATTAQPAPCSAEVYRQFDFWIGDWDVQGANGRPAGRNIITAEYGGCVIHERWTGAGGMNGSSFNIYRPHQSQWHQSWVDNGGTLLLLDGEFRDGKMILSGPGRGPGGTPVLNRVTWERIGGDPNRVRQLWEVSSDNGGTWTAVFNGTYNRRP